MRAKDGLAKSVDCRRGDFIKTKGRCLKMCKRVTIQRPGDNTDERRGYSSPAELTDCPKNTRFEFARRWFSEGDRCNFGGLDPAGHHHRDPTRHQRRLAGPGCCFDQYIGGKICQGASSSV